MFLIWMYSSLPPVGPRNATPWMTTVLDGAACAAGAATAAAMSAASAILKIRGVTMWESFPRGNPYDFAGNLHVGAALT